MDLYTYTSTDNNWWSIIACIFDISIHPLFKEFAILGYLVSSAFATYGNDLHVVPVFKPGSLA